MTPAARIAAATALLDAIARDRARPADAVASGFFRERRYIGGGDRREVSGIVWDILRRDRRLSWWLERGRSVPPHPARLLVAAHLLLGGTLRLETLRTLYSGGRYAEGTLDPDEARILAALDGHTLDHPGMPDPVRMEIPDWILPLLAERFGAGLEAELAALSQPADLDLRVNLLVGTRDEARAALSREGIETELTRYSPWGLRAEGRQNVTATEAFRSGLVEIQDEGSQLVALAVGAGPGMRVCDYCAGAAGKTLAIAMTMDNRGQIVACDVSHARLEGAVRRLRRAGIHNVERHLLIAGDKWAKRRAGGFDRVLVDAPCTGTGTWRRNPDARRHLEPEALDRLVARQAEILSRASRLVRPGGHLIYATCSLLREENEARIDAFLAHEPGFVLIPPDALGLPGQGETMSLTPHRHGTDGFFAAILRRGPATDGQPSTT